MVIDEMCEKLNGLSHPEDGGLPASEPAVKFVCGLLRSTAERLGDDEMPMGFVSSDLDRSVRIEWWHNNTNSVHVVVSADVWSRNYVFSKFGPRDRGEIFRPADSRCLSEQLQRLNEHLKQPTP